MASPISRGVTGPAMRPASLTNPPVTCTWRIHQAFQARNEITGNVSPWYMATLPR